MRTILRRLRGAVFVGVTWSVLWIAIGLVLFGVITIVDPGQVEPGEGLRTVLPILGTVGFLSGLGFSALLSIIERHRPLEKLSIARVALWGALGSGAIPLLMSGSGGVWPETAVLGAVCAAATLAIARKSRAPSPVEA